MIRADPTESETEQRRSRTESHQAHTGWCLKLDREANRLTRSRGFDLGFERLKFEIENRRNLDVHARIGVKEGVVNCGLQVQNLLNGGSGPNCEIGERVTVIVNVYCLGKRLGIFLGDAERKLQCGICTWKRAVT